MMRVIHNLARNASQAMPNGGGFIIRTRDEEEGIVFEFKDNGMGIPVELQGRLFDPFTTAGKKGGTGLGLAIVKKIIDDHRGDIRVTSAPGQGTCFTVSLPKRTPEELAEEHFYVPD
jgi:signal transduction histidine kinase